MFAKAARQKMGVSETIFSIQQKVFCWTAPLYIWYRYMRRIILIGLLLIFLSSNAFSVYDYIGTNEKYRPGVEDNYKSIINQMVPNSGLLEVSCFFWEDYVSMKATVDNTSMDNIVMVLLASTQSYIYLYNDLGFPNKAEISINKPGGQFGTPVATGVVYSKWVKDFNADSKIDVNVAWRTIVGKVADTTTSY
jgi:hypothetical protein